MFAVFEQILILFLFCVIGYLLSKGKIVNPGHTQILSALLVYVFTPFLSFNNFATNFDFAYLQERYLLVVIGIVLLVLTYPIGAVVSRLLTKHPYNKEVYHYSVIAPNTGFLGYPLCLAVFGELALLDMMIFVLPLTTYMNTLAFNRLTKQTGGRIQLKRIFTPGIIALLLGSAVGLSGIELPKVIDQVTKTAGSCMGPVSMLLTGIAISQYPLKSLLLEKKSYITALLRLLVIPALVCVFIKLLSLVLPLVGLSALLPVVSVAATIAVMTYALPCGMNTIVFPKLVGEECQVGASLVMITTIASLVTIPFCLEFLIG